jgi:spermidine/putrescine transport system ATP-binding protein
MDGFAEKEPHYLSGGQKQRVAIARCLVLDPAVLLLDEPLSALDLKLRQHMRAELRALQKETGVTFIYITHDQSEALAMSDRVAVMSDGVLQQVGAPRELYDDPATPFVATFVGETNALKGTLTSVENDRAVIESALGRFVGRAGCGLTVGAPATLFVRPEALRFGEGELNALRARITRVDFEGAFAMVHAELAGGAPLCVAATGSDRDAALRPGDTAAVVFPEDAAVVMGP